ncbi:MAG: enoyl-CoA hydratase/isomerase family protein [Myxococcales bacterium]|nr:enoyl-CoA hydratase/isomerase family protein [Myxococcales bacterium]
MRIERHGEVAVLRLESGKVNAIGSAFLEGLNALLDGLGDAKAAVVVGRGNAFSAGLDLHDLVDLDRASMRSFIAKFDATMLRLWELPIPLVAAVNGHAIAGGCVLALQADLRLAADKDARIGLNETQLGIGLPAVVLETLRAQVPPSSLAAIALEGRLFSPREALQLGLLHEVVPEAELFERALARAQSLAALWPAGVRQVKSALRAPVAARIREIDATQSEKWVESWLSAEPILRSTVARLKK